MDETDYMEKIVDCYRMLLPENLVRPNMLAGELTNRRAQIRACIFKYFRYIGREVTAQEAFEWEKNNERNS